MALFRDKPGGRPSIRELVQKAEQAGDPFQAGAIYTQAAELALDLGKKRRAIGYVREAGAALSAARTDSRTLAGAFARLAQTADKLGLVQEAMYAYSRAFGLDPSLVAAAQAARAIAMGESAWPTVIDLLEQEIAVVANRRDRADLMCQQAILLRDKLGDLDAAITHLQRAVKQDPASVPGHRELAASLVRRSERREDHDWAARDRDDAAGILCDMADIVPDDERVECIETALDIAPEHLGALEKLEQVAPDDLDRLVFRWSRHIDSFPDSPIADELRLRLGQAHLSAGRSEAALPYFEELARQNDLESALVVVDIHARAGRTREARAWGKAARDRVRGEKRLAILRHVFRALDGRDDGGAYETAREIVAEDPTDAIALSHCEAYCTHREDWSLLDALLTDVASSFEPGAKRRLSLLRKLAALREERRRDPAAALETWRTVEAESDDESVPAARAERIRLAEHVGAWDELTELLEDECESASGDQRAQLLLRIAEVHRAHRADPESAARALLRVLETRADVDEADVLASLSNVLRASGAASRVFDETAAYATDAPAERKAAVSRVLARLYDDWGDDARAFDAWTRVREVLPDDVEAVTRLIELAIATGKHEHAIELLTRKIARAESREAVELHRRIASIATEHLDDHDRAADALTTALELDREDRRVAEELCAALDRAGRHGEQTVVLRLLAGTAPDEATRLETRKRLARLLSTRLRDAEEALGVWEQIAADTADVDILHQLAAEAREEDDASRLEVLLRRLAVVAPTAERRAELSLEHAEVLARTLGRPREAIVILADATARDAATYLPALAYLESLCEKAGDHRLLASTLERQVPLVPESTRKLVLMRLAGLYEGPLDDPASAVHTLERWETVRPDEIEPRRRLIPHLVAMRSWTALLERLDRLLALAQADRAKWIDLVVTTLDAADPAHDAPLAALFIELAKRAASPEQRRDLLIRAAAIFELSGESAAAFDAAAGALAITGPEERLLSIVDRLASEADRLRDLDTIYDRFTGKGAPPEMRRSLTLRHTKHLVDAGRFGDALDRLLRVSALAPTDDALLDATEQVASRASRVPEVLSAYEDRVALVEPGGPAVGLMLRAIRASYANERGYDALRFVARAVQLSDGDLALLERIEAVATEIGRPAIEQVMTVYEASARKEPVADRRASLLVRAARLMLRIEPEAKPAAFRLLDEAIAIAPTEEWLLDAVESIASDVGLVERLDVHLEKMIDETMSDAVAAALLRRRARILHHHIGKPSEAADAYLRLWALRPKDPDVFRSLRVCLLETGRVHELISAAERELTRLDEDAQRIALMREVARLWEEDARNQWEAADAWKRVLAHAPGDAAATAAVARLTSRDKGE